MGSVRLQAVLDTVSFSATDQHGKGTKSERLMKRYMETDFSYRMEVSMLPGLGL